MVLPLCRCRVLYIGSAVPTVTKDGLQGIQQPLRERYPVDDSPETRGIDSWLSVWSNGILLEYIEGDKKSESAFFPINTLHYCAAVRYVNVTGYAVEGGGERFLPLDSPFADIPESNHPPIFAAILRRTTGVKVLECHGFICTNNKAANALVRCCFHAYADCMYLRMDEKIPGLKAIEEGSVGDQSPGNESDDNQSVDEADAAHKPNHWDRRQQDGEYDSVSISSSMMKRNGIPKRAASEDGAMRHAMVPYEDAHIRRAGSDADLSCAERFSVAPPPHLTGGAPLGFPPRHHMFPPPPHAFQRPPQHGFPHPNGFPPPPPNGFPPGNGFPPPPPFFRPPPPHFMPPPHMMMPPPRGFFPPPPFGMPPPGAFQPPRGMFHPPPFHPMFRPPTATPDSGPIITGPDSIYGTIPRRNAYEEPAYMSAGGPPESSYQPGNYPQEQYEAYYDTLKKKSLKKGSGSVSSNRDHGSAVWEQYEAGVYRKPHMNEKAFSNTLRSTAAKEQMSPSLSRHENEETSSQTVQAEINRPDTPPVDYVAHKQKGPNRTAVY